MTSKEYAAERRDPRWQMMRLKVFERDKAKCHDCGDSTKTLSVHHRYYIKGRKCWDYPMWALITTCSKCHKLTHAEPEEDEDPSQISEWEQIIEFFTGGNPDVLAELWYASICCAQMRDLGLSGMQVRDRFTMLIKGELARIERDGIE